MSNSLNRVMLIGRLGNDVQVHKFEDGNSIANFSLATTETYFSKEKKEKVKTTEWHRVVFKNHFAEICEQNLSKGDLVYVEGKLHHRKWEDKETTKYIVEVVGEAIRFLNTKLNGSKVDSTLLEESPF